MNHPISAFCERVARLSPSVLAVMVASGGRLTGSYLVKGFVLSDRERMASLLVQAEIMVSVPATNKEYFGKVNYVMVDHSGVHNFFFPARGVGVLAVTVVPPYDAGSLISRIASLLDKVAVICDTKGEENT